MHALVHVGRQDACAAASMGASAWDEQHAALTLAGDIRCYMSGANQSTQDQETVRLVGAHDTQSEKEMLDTKGHAIAVISEALFSAKGATQDDHSAEAELVVRFAVEGMARQHRCRITAEASGKGDEVTAICANIGLAYLVNASLHETGMHQPCQTSFGAWTGRA